MLNGLLLYHTIIKIFNNSNTFIFSFSTINKYSYKIKYKIKNQKMQ